VSNKQRIPEELKKLKQWVCADKDKVPINPKTRTKALVNDPKTWGTYEDVIKTGLPNIGFVLTKEDPYAFIDLDEPTTEAQKKRHNLILESFESYTEISQSGKGIHIIVKGEVPRGVKRDKVEVYSELRYMICTGNCIKNYPINDCQEMLDILYSEMAEKKFTRDKEYNDETLTDSSLINMASNASNGKKFDALCNGDWKGSYPSQSEADFALLTILCFYSKSDEQVKRVFRMTSLGEREKAREGYYLDRCLSHIRGKQSIQGEVLPDKEVKKVKKKKKLKKKHKVEFPKGLLGEIADYVYSSSIRPVPEVSLACAMSLVAGIVGRNYNISGTGLNQYLILLAKTGTGKEGIANGIDSLINSVRLRIPLADTFLGPSAFASGQALIKVLDAQPCFVSVLGEFGHTMEQLSEPRAPAHTVMLRKVLLDLYSKSGWDKYLRPSVYSDKDKDTELVRAPNVTIIGESTPESFYGSLDKAQVASGLLPRFSIIEYFGKRPPTNKKAFHDPPEELVDKLSGLLKAALNLQQQENCVNVTTEPDAQEMLDKYDTWVDAKMNDKFANDTVHQLWNRAHLKVLKISALIAVGTNPHSPVVDKECVRWAIDFVNNDVNILLDRFNTGGIGFGTEKQESIVRRAFLDYMEFTKKQKTSYKIPKLVKETNLIPYSYLRRRLKSSPELNNTRNGFESALTGILNEMVKAEIIVEIDKYEAKTNYNVTTPLYTLGQSW